MTFANKFAVSKYSFPRLFKFSKRSSRKSSPRRKVLHFPQILDIIRIIHSRPYRTDAELFFASVRGLLNSPPDSFCRNNRTPANGLADEFHLVVCISRLPPLIKSRVISRARTRAHDPRPGTRSSAPTRSSSARSRRSRRVRRRGAPHCGLVCSVVRLWKESYHIQSVDSMTPKSRI